jgi:hypothetical protein
MVRDAIRRRLHLARTCLSIGCEATGAARAFGEDSSRAPAQTLVRACRARRCTCNRHIVTPRFATRSVVVDGVFVLGAHHTNEHSRRARPPTGSRYVYRAVDQHGHIIDVYVSAQRDTRAARRFFENALRVHDEPVEVVTDRAPALRAMIEELMPAAFHNTERYANNRIEADRGRLKRRDFGRCVDSNVTASPSRSCAVTR